MISYFHFLLKNCLLSPYFILYNLSLLAKSMMHKEDKSCIMYKVVSTICRLVHGAKVVYLCMLDKSLFFLYDWHRVEKYVSCRLVS
jgi:hypothetical protein